MTHPTVRRPSSPAETRRQDAARGAPAAPKALPVAAPGSVQVGGGSGGWTVPRCELPVFPRATGNLSSPLPGV